MATSPMERRAGPIDAAATRLLDVTLALVLAVISIPVALVVAIVVKMDSPGPVFYRCRRVGLQGRPFGMLKFRKMYDGARGPGLTATEDGRFTRVGRVLARSKLDELPQLWNVLRGEMSLVGPRPEDPSFVATRPDDFAPVQSVRPGITGLSQLAFADESAILDADDRVRDYLDRILPQKMELDGFYACRRSLAMDIRILFWTVVAVVFRRDVAVHRGTGRTSLRRRPRPAMAPVGRPAPARAHAPR
jgi:lipopolysaccharide/colanic/teichoic acid biosynthesis glycosyltransferase